jgi:hypothetical protein
MTNHLTPKGECGCKKKTVTVGLDYEKTGVFDATDHIAQSRYHAEAIREAINMAKDAGECPNETEKQWRYFAEKVKEAEKLRDAVLKCMEGQKAKR